MSKLDEILREIELGSNWQKRQLKILVLELWAEVLHESNDLAEASDKFGEKVKAL